MRGLERRNDALAAAQIVERGDGFRVVDGYVLSPAGVLEPGVLGAYARVIQPRRDRMRLADLAVFVLKQVGAVSVQHARPARAQRRRMLAARYAQSTRLHADELDLTVGNIGKEDPHCIRPPADAGDHRVRLAAAELRHLGQALATDD